MSQTYTSKKRAPAAQPQTAGGAGTMSANELLHRAGVGAPQPMSAALREKFEPGFGADFSHVRISRGHIPEELGVQAVARGTDILLDSRAGMDVLGHELAHVVQQAKGQVQGGFPVVHDPALEHQADVMGARAAAGQWAMGEGMTGLGGGERMSIAPMSGAQAPAQCKSRAEKKAEKAAAQAAKEQRQRLATEKEMLLTSSANASGAKLQAATDWRENISNEGQSRDIAEMTMSQQQSARALLAEEKAEPALLGQSFQAAQERYQKAGNEYKPVDVYHDRYLRRHLHGLDEQTQDRMFAAFAQNNRAGMAEFLRQDFDKYRQQTAELGDSMSVYADTQTMLDHFSKSRKNSQDMMAPSDLVKKGYVSQEELGIGEEEWQEMKEQMQVASTRNGIHRQRISAMARAADTTRQGPAPAAAARSGWARTDVSDGAYSKAPRPLAGGHRSELNRLKKKGWY